MALTQLKTGAIADDAVTTDKLANAINTERTANTAKVSLEDNAVTLAKMAGGTDGQIITYDASGDPVAVGPGTDGQVLTSTGAGSPPAFEDASGTTINNNADNRVITGSGTASTLNGESALTFDGSTLTLSTTGAPVITIGSTNAGSASLVLDGDSNGDASGTDYSYLQHNTDGDLDIVVDNPADAGNIKFFTNSSSERLRIDSSGRVGIGCTPTAQFAHNILQIGNQATLGANAALSTTGQTYLTHNLYFDTSGTYQVFNTGSANEGAIVSLVDGTFKFSNAAATTGTPTVTERMRIDSSGNVGIGTTPDSGVNLHVQHDGEANMILEGNVNGQGGYLMLKNNSDNANTTMSIQNLDAGGQGTSEITFQNVSNANNEGLMMFKTRPSGGSMTERMRITSDGYVTKSNHPAFCYKKLDNAHSGSRMTNDGDLEFKDAILSSSHYNASNGRFTAPVAGTYFFSISLLLDDNATDGTRYVYLRINDSNTINMIYNYFHNTGSAKYYHCSGSGIVTLAASDYVTFYGNEGWHVGSESMISGHFLG